MAVFIQFFIGLIFGVGLVVSGMSDPAKVLNFLDLAAIPEGTWDPSLAFVMAGAVTVAFVGFRAVFRRRKPVFAGQFHLPTVMALDARIVCGPAIFGVGWGLAGFCPGPAFTAIASGTSAALIFVSAMLIGMIVARQIAHRTPFTAARIQSS
jgi:uncharacterized membrane protein YedE/YeeE